MYTEEDEEYYDIVSELVRNAGIEISLDFQTVLADRILGLTPEKSAEEFINEYK